MNPWRSLYFSTQHINLINVYIYETGTSKMNVRLEEILLILTGKASYWVIHHLTSRSRQKKGISNDRLKHDVKIKLILLINLYKYTNIHIHKRRLWWIFPFDLHKSILSDSGTFQIGVYYEMFVMFYVCYVVRVMSTDGLRQWTCFLYRFYFTNRIPGQVFFLHSRVIWISFCF